MDRLIDAYALECKLRFENGDMSQAVVSEFDIAEAPTIDPVRHGRWVHYPNNNSHVVEADMCSECKNEYVFGDVYNYCPNCGAKMDGAT